MRWLSRRAVYGTVSRRKWPTAATACAAATALIAGFCYAHACSWWVWSRLTRTFVVTIQ